MIRLRQKDIERLAIITDGSVDYLTKLVSMSLIDHNYALDLLIKYSYKKLKAEKRYTPGQMIEALMRECRDTLSIPAHCQGARGVG